MTDGSPRLMMCGGYTGAKDANDSVQEVLDGVKAKVEERTGRSFETFKAVKYHSQVVAGTNFKIKAQVGDSDFIHVKIFRPLPCYGTELELHDVEEGKLETDAI